jgi:hypothetical protein
MSLFPDPQPTQGEIVRQQAVELNTMIERILGLAKSFTSNMFNRFWNNPKVTPSEMSAIYGTSAKDLFIKLAQWQGAIQQIDPSYVPITVPEKWEYVLNEDGSVTITEKVVEPEPIPEQ